MILRVGIFLKIIFWIETHKKNWRFIIYYTNDKCFLVLVVYLSFWIFFIKKQKKKPVRQNFVILFSFWLKIGSVGHEDQHINLISPKWKTKQSWRYMYSIISLYSQYFSPGAGSNVYKTYFYFLKLTKKYFILSSKSKKLNIKLKICTFNTHNKLKPKSPKIQTFLYTLPKKRH